MKSLCRCPKTNEMAVSVFQKWRSFPLRVWVGSSTRSLRSDAALEAIAKASEDKVPNIVVYNYPTFSGAFSALFAHLFHARHNLPSLILPFSSVPFLALRFSSNPISFNSLNFLSFVDGVLCFLVLQRFEVLGGPNFQGLTWFHV